MAHPKHADANQSILSINPQSAAPMVVRLVTAQYRYDYTRHLNCDANDWMVEFFDRSFAGEPGFPVFGQYITRLCLNELLRQEGRPLVLNGRVSQWWVDAATTAQVAHWARGTAARTSQA